MKTKAKMASAEIGTLDGKTFDVCLKSVEGLPQDGKLVFGHESDITIRTNLGGYKFRKIFSKNGSVHVMPPAAGADRLRSAQVTRSPAVDRRRGAKTVPIGEATCRIC